MIETVLKPRPRVLVLDDELEMAEMLADGLNDGGYQATAVRSARKAVKILEDEQVDALVTDLRMPEMDGLEVLAISRKLDPRRPVIVMTAYSAVDTAIESIRRGAYHYLTKPFKADEVALFLGRALEDAGLRREAVSLKRALRDRYSISNLVGKSAALVGVVHLIEKVADATVPVLVLGETGTGKGVVARAIHAEGPRAERPFVSVNCAALPETLLESELFGHVKGAFTGASANRDGLFVEADGGTLFLDEVGEMSAGLQAKLLHVLENGSVRAVGASKDRPIDTRVVAATHRQLRERVATGLFREDLLYRLEVVSIEIPPLRHRREDLPDLMMHFLARTKEKHPKSPVSRLGQSAIDLMLSYGWPGNVRELEHVIERLVLLGGSEEVSAAELPALLRAPPRPHHAFEGPVMTLKDIQRRYAAWAFEQLGGRKLVTAETLDIDPKTLTKLLALDE